MMKGYQGIMAYKICCKYLFGMVVMMMVMVMMGGDICKRTGNVLRDVNKQW